MSRKWSDRGLLGVNELAPAFAVRSDHVSVNTGIAVVH